MASKKRRKALSTERGLSRQSADQVPQRALALLRAAGTDENIFTVLATSGFTKGELERGWTLLRAACSTTAVAYVAPNPAAEARANVEAWRGPWFRRARAALRHLHAEAADFVFHDLGDRPGLGAFETVTIFLSRCDALENGASRRRSRKADHAALATLAARGLTKDERRRVREQIDAALRLPAVLPQEATASKETRDAHLAELHAWVQDWSETARAVIKRRDHLIRLGIGKRKPRRPAAASSAEGG